jgi:hypothetical protein
MRKQQKLQIITKYYEEYDVKRKPSSQLDSLGKADDTDLVCGKDSTILVRNFSIEQAQHYFRQKNVRVLIQCPTCDSYNLLAAAFEIGDDGTVITLPGGE